MVLVLDSILRRVVVHGAWRKEISSRMQICITKLFSLSALRNNRYHTMLCRQTFSGDLRTQSQSIWPEGCPCSQWSFLSLQLYVTMEYATETTRVGRLLHDAPLYLYRACLRGLPRNELSSCRPTDTRGPWQLSRVLPVQQLYNPLSPASRVISTGRGLGWSG